MHQLYSIIEGVDATHPHVGNVIAFGVVATKAKKCLLIISPAGCGKSATTNLIASLRDDSITLDSVTRSGLRDFKDVFTHFQGLVVIDDLGKVDTNYSRIHTVTSFAELCYSHFIAKHTMSVTVEIFEFHGSAIINIQPPVLGMLYEADEWEVVTQDKTIRYYHLYRPTKPNDNFPVAKVDWGIDLNLVHKPRHDFKLYSTLAEICSIQWSDARVLEHLDSLLKAIAALDRRQEVIASDLVLLHRLIKPMTVERHVKYKSGFETGRRMDTNLLAVLVEFATWPNVDIARIARDYKISHATTYRLLSEMTAWFQASESKSKMLVRRPELTKVLKEAGVGR